MASFLLEPILEIALDIIRSNLARYLVSVPPPDDEWLKEMRGNLGMIATVIATMAFQNGLNPPGGVVQNGDKGTVSCPTPKLHGQACPGQSVYAAVDTHGYTAFMISNSLSFLFSIATCIMVISGSPIGPGYPTLVLAMYMSLSLLLLAVSYVLGAFLLNPHVQTNYSIIIYVIIFVPITILVSFVCFRFAALIMAVRQSNEEATHDPTSTEEEKIETHNTQQVMDSTELDAVKTQLQALISYIASKESLAAILSNHQTPSLVTHLYLI
ncbi:uncharacterized protein DS421_2g37030 [Arachis hypogaea]|nr:uncharacterized protein DS421_2g37030 [Arachis hypogaea]